MDNPEELFPIVDESGNIIGSVRRQAAHNGSKILHPVVHLHVFDTKGNIYLQKRPVWKDIQPDKWDTACGGHVDLGENIKSALRREAKEELGLTEFDINTLGNYIFESTRERELVYVHTTVINSNTIIRPNKNELAEGKFWSKEEIINNMNKNVFTPNFEQEYQRFFMGKENNIPSENVWA